VHLGKLLPAYNTGTYTDNNPLIGPGTNSVTLTYTSSTGNWSISGSNLGSPTTGAWTNTPATTYEYQITGVTVNDTNGGAGSITPASPTAWATISGTTTICAVSAEEGVNLRDVTFSISVRKVGDTTPIQNSSINLVAVKEA
jgi:hypothetical protein